MVDLLIHHDLLGDLLEVLDDLLGLWESKGPASTERKGGIERISLTMWRLGGGGGDEGCLSEKN